MIAAEERFYRQQAQRKARKRGEITEPRDARKTPARHKHIREAELWVVLDEES